MEQRREPRFAADKEVPVTLMRGREFRLLGQARNVSPRGMALELRMPVSTGSRLRVEMESGPVFGEVVYCRKIDDGYFVGVKLEAKLENLAEITGAPPEAA
jgi:hypothetical protein